MSEDKVNTRRINKAWHESGPSYNNKAEADFVQVCKEEIGNIGLFRMFQLLRYSAFSYFRDIQKMNPEDAFRASYLSKETQLKYGKEY